MEAEEGFAVLTQRGWLSTVPAAFRRAVLARSIWRHCEPGAPITLGGAENGDLFGIARGTIEVTTIFGRADTPMVHIAGAVFWLGYGPIISGQLRRASVNARSPVWLARTPQNAVMDVLTARPEWWRHLGGLALEYGDIASNIAADLMIRDSRRRCAAVLLRLSGCRFGPPMDDTPVEAPVTQDELAAMANLSRNSVGTVLRALASDGLLEIGYGAITVSDPAALRTLVDAA